MTDTCKIPLKHLTNTGKGLEKLKTPVKDCKIVVEIRVENTL